MGIYLNPSSLNFQRCLNSEIYIDKSDLIKFTNSVIGTERGFVCVSRPRRFGKTMAADMLAAYYGNEEDTDYLFQGLSIRQDASYKKYLNRFHVIKVDMQSFLNKGGNVKGLISLLSQSLVRELKAAYPQEKTLPIFLSWKSSARLEYNFNENDLSEVFNYFLKRSGKQFVIIIDEWDCVMRRIHDWSEQKKYLDFLRDWLKNQPYVALAYMTGILPIKKYGEHSTLNMFKEYSMIDSAQISGCFGFLEDEVRMLCSKYNADFEQMREWYDGYHLVSESFGDKTEYSVYSPNSIVEAISRGKYEGYWNRTETYEALQKYIRLNMDGLQEAVTRMLSGDSIRIDTETFKNDMYEFHGRDEVLTLLVHLGYLTYDQEKRTVSIPNKEVSAEFVRSVNRTAEYAEVAASIQASKELLEALWNCDCKKVAEGVEKAHQSFPSIHYNNENALSCVIELAFYYAREYYTIVRELPTGKGLADICLIPKTNHTDKPAVIIELKWNQSAECAMEQIKRKDYPDILKAYHGNLLLCGINYEKDNLQQNKRHQCIIEKYVKE